MIKICNNCKKKFNARRSSLQFCSKKCADKHKTINLFGKSFGNWVVLKKKPKSSKKGYFWKCKCKCGKEKFVFGSDLRKGISKSCGCIKKLPLGESACKWLFNYYKNTCAKSRNHVWELSLEDFKIITKQDCYYCGSGLSNLIDRHKDHANGTYSYNGIDRKDNSKGYTKKNVVSCCKLCNSMKSKLDDKAFLKQVKKIAEYHKVYI